jgi:hypothetical protein
MRGLLQFQVLPFRTFQISGPLERTAGNISAALDFFLQLTSVGSPETDRGPPRS